MKSPTLRSFLRILPLVVSATFAPLGTRGMWWPALWGLAFGRMHERAYSLLALLASLVLFVLCALIHRLARSSATSVPRER